jgi:hypothetical protein
LKYRLLGLAVIAAALGVWFWTSYIRKAVDIREAEASDRIHERYFGFAYEDMTARNILVATDTFTKSTWLSGILHLVHDGLVDVVNTWAVGRSSNRLGDGIWERMKITVALGEKYTAAGRVTNLGSAGETHGEGQGGGLPNTVNALFSLAMPGRIVPGGKHIVYLEGDREPILDPEMSLDDFARKNTGSYLVVTLELH